MAISYRDIPEEPARDLQLRMFERWVDAVLVLRRGRDGGMFPFPESFDQSMIDEVTAIYCDVGWKAVAQDGARLILALPDALSRLPR